MDYGDHLAKITFQTANRFGFLTDAGWVADVDMHVSHVAGTQKANVRCVTSKRSAFMDRIESELDYNIDISKTSESSPHCLRACRNPRPEESGRGQWPNQPSPSDIKRCGTQ